MRLLQIIVCKENIWRDTLWWNHFLTCDQCNMSYKDLTLKTIREYTLGRSYFHVINVARVFFKEIILEHIIVCIPRRSHFHVISGTKVFSHKIPSYKTSKRIHWGEAMSMYLMWQEIFFEILSYSTSESAHWEANIYFVRLTSNDN